VVTTGVTGGTWRGDVTAGGAVEPWDGSPTLGWYVAADDRWHDPAIDTGVRQTRIEGSAVVETRVRIPGGDAIQRVWSVPDAGGLTLMSIRNESALPIACAVTRSDVVTTRVPADVPIQGIDLPADSIVLPVAHRTEVVVGLAHRAPAAGRLPTGLPPADAVARGWVARADAASRLELPDIAETRAVRAARCELALGRLVSRAADPARFLLGVGELIRMGELGAPALAAGDLVADVAEAVGVLVRAPVGAQTGELAGPALVAAGVILHAAGERRAVRDVRRLAAARKAPHGRRPTGGAAVDRPGGLGPSSDADRLGSLGDGGDDGDGDGGDGGDGGDHSSLGSHDGGDGDVAVVAALEGCLLSGTTVLPGGIPAGWRGTDFEAHGLVAGPGSRLSVAARWHGPNLAVLWELAGEPVDLRSGVDPAWATAAPSGEALWVVPADVA
jgi:hypothetical protein